MQNRIRLVRKRAGLNQTEFGAALGGATQGMITSYETGRVVPDGAFISLVCKTFGVSRAWLETGAEPMYTADDPEAPEAMVPDLVDVLSSRPDLLALVKRFYSVMGPDDWDALNAFARRLLDEIKKE